jgi:molybdenum cofactor cytidylyltransferase
MIYGVIPAAGKSTRMGRPKLTLPLAGKTVLEHVLHALGAADVGPTVVVVGPHVRELAPLAEAAGARALLLPRETDGMRATVEEGLRWLEHWYKPRHDDAWLLVPADHPGLDAECIRQLVHCWPPDAPHSIVIPTYQGKRGHPTLIGWRHVAGIRALPPDRGLNRYIREHAANTLEFALDCPGVVCDLDTPEDYEKLLKPGERGA